jgi:lipopolysaccharide biosynthesis glycosyltransferase
MSVSASNNAGSTFAAIACADANMLPAACCALLSVYNNTHLVKPRLFLFAIGVGEKQIADIEAFGRRHSIGIEVLCDTTSQLEGNSFGRWSRATLARLYMDIHVPAEIGSLLYIDADAVAVAPLDELFRRDLGGKALAAVDDYLMAFADKIGRRQKRIGLRPKGRYFNAGVLLFDWPKCCKTGALQRARDTFEKEPDRYLAHDQDVLNVVFQDNWLALEPRFNGQTGILPFVGPPAIVHFTGRKKPWQAVMPWKHRRMKAFYEQALERTPWVSFCKGSSISDKLASFASHFSTLLATPKKVATVRAYFG